MSRSPGSLSSSISAIGGWTSQIKGNTRKQMSFLLTGRWDLLRALEKELVHTRCRLLQQLLSSQFQECLPLWRDCKVLASGKQCIKSEQTTHLCTRRGAMILSRSGLS